MHIGKELLTQNNQLERKVAELDAELRSANDTIAQCQHDLMQKTELINILTENDDTVETPSPTNSKSLNFNFDILQRKINTLETENKTLHSEVAQVVKETDEVEEQERRLMNDLTEQLNSSNLHFESLTFEIERYKEETRLQNEQIFNLSTRLNDTQMRLHELLSENDETISVLNITKENQNLLANELRDYKEKYQETLALLQETQNLLREKNKRTQPMTRSSYIPGLPSQYNPDSLQSELMESSLFSENSLDSGIHSDNGQPKPVPMFKKVFDTVKCAGNSSAFKTSDMSLSSSTELISSQPRMSCSIYSSEIGKSSEKLTSHSMYSSIYGGAKSEDNFTSSDSDDGVYTNRGVPGCPGAKDLEKALNNLTSADILVRRSMLTHAPAGTYSYDDPIQCQTPESMFSNMSASTSSTLSQYRYPKRLEIVKPLEGSFTLNHWKGLATPAMSGLLHENERVKVRGEKGLDELGMQLYSLSDVEEDIDDYPGKQFDSSPCIYTYTNSYVMHPDDGTSSITFSLPPSQMSSRMESRQTTCPSTPRTLSRRNSCSTFSVNVGIASMLNERGIKAVTPSCLNTPSGANFSPTVTPCNSPTGSTSPTEQYQDTETSLTSFLSSSAGILRKKITGHDPERSHRAARILENKAKVRSIRLLERVENLGIENILATNASSRMVSPLALHSSNIYTRYNSPMMQLTSLKHLSEKKKAPETEAEDKSSAGTNRTETQSETSSTNQTRTKQKFQRQKSRRNMNGNGQRSDLGTVNVSKSPETKEEKSLVGGFVGSISSIFFGRKGGLL